MQTSLLTQKQPPTYLFRNLRLFDPRFAAVTLIGWRTANVYDSSAQIVTTERLTG
jgi:hypothetical protein